MSDIINILPESVANQIAAGEVVDRPASAVKELMENALDAGATHIQLIVKDAGRTLIQVVDDGCGMSEGDARRCFERHATSKIRQANDLFALHTMGFRGEALAAIAAIAQVELQTRTHDNELGTAVTVEGGRILNQSACSTAPGTSISVKNLFFNVPARRNFLKRDSVELSHIEETFRRIALAHCDVAFSFYSNDRPLYELRVANLAQRITHLFGDAYKERLYYIEEHSDIVSLHGYVGKIDFARRTRGDQYLYVNGRFIKHPSLGAAIEKAYADLIPDRHYPGYFVMLEVHPDRIDVNIHPTKTEVRFIDEHAIFAILRAAVKKALGLYSLDSRIEFDPSTEIDFSPAPAGYIPHEPKIQYNSAYNPFNEHRSAGGGRQQWENFFDEEDKSSAHEPAPQLQLPPQEPVQPATCIQVGGRWIVGALPSGLLIVDQQRAHERILYERYCARNDDASPQQLLFPVTCTFSPADAEILAELLPALRRQGIIAEPFGRNSYVVSAVPDNGCEPQLQQLLQETIADYKASLMQPADKDPLCLALARRMAVQQGVTLCQEEMQQIVADLFRCQTPQYSPSGQRCMAVLSDQELTEVINTR
ncbi:MAG: DNA mismatch repair protein MutL [bacterium P3]|nr:MAG: DNA mismatch repair protein MutL [bacterium P3]KWW41992.1 MAG: DNA mismatch repair protein MutL [bacterium F083]